MGLCAVIVEMRRDKENGEDVLHALDLILNLMSISGKAVLYLVNVGAE